MNAYRACPALPCVFRWVFRCALHVQGFEEWTRRDFQAFLRACERFGRYVWVGVGRFGRIFCAC